MPAEIKKDTSQGAHATKLREIANAIDNGLVDGVFYCVTLKDGDVRFGVVAERSAIQLEGYSRAALREFAKHSIDEVIFEEPKKPAKKAVRKRARK